MDRFALNVTRALEYARDVVAETLWPTRCAMCDSPGKLICDKCASELPFIDACLACPVCGAPYGSIQCTECNETILGRTMRASIPYNEMAFALLANEATKNLVKAYKNGSERRLAPIIADICSRYVNPDWMRRKCPVTFIPDTGAAVRKRGFDHGRELAECLASILNCEYVSLFDRPHAKDQRSLDRLQRFENMGKALRVAQNAVVPSQIIVFDDVCTTGATLFAAADALRDAGAKRIYAIALCRVLA